MKTSTIEVSTPDGNLPVYVAEPDEKPTAAVVVFQEAFGVNDHIEDVTRRFAAEGFLAVAPHLFHRSGGGTVDYSDVPSVMPHLQAATDERVLMDFDAALAVIAEHGISPERTATVGFCFGGRCTFLVSLNRDLGAAVGFYGGGIVPALVDQSGELKTPWLGLFGDLDAHIAVEDVERLRSTLDAKTSVDHEVVRYADADHGFHCDARASYEPKAAKDGWKRTLEWFRSHLG